MLLLFLFSISITPYTSDVISQRIECFKSINKWQEQEAAVLGEEKIGEFVESGACHFITHRLILINTKKGKEDYSTVEVQYTPLYNKVIFHFIKVYKVDGRIIEIPLEKVEDLPIAARVIFWGERKKTITIPGIEVGDVIELCYEVYGVQVALLSKDEFTEYTPPMEEEFYYVELFQDYIPILKKTFRVEGPLTKALNHKIYYRMGIEDKGMISFEKGEENGKFYYQVLGELMSPIEKEPEMLPKGEIATKVIVTTISDWEKLSRWMYEITESMLSTDDAIKDKVKQLTRGEKSNLDKINGLFHFVSDSIRYIGLSMGKGEGYTPHPVTMTFRERGGVCKDKAALLTAMLREAGFESYICMTSAMERIEDIPANQFNHAVTAIKSDSGYIFLDPTWGNFSREWFSFLEQQQSILVATKEGETLMKTRAKGGKFVPIIIDASFNISKKGELKGSLKFIFNYGIEQWIRNLFHYLKREEWEESVKSQFLSYYGTEIRIDTFSIQNLNTMDSLLKIDIDFSIPDYGIISGEYFLFPSPSLTLLRNFSSGFMYLSSLPNRKYPFYSLFCISSDDINAFVSIPDGYLPLLTPLNLLEESLFGKFSYSCERKGNRIDERIAYSFDKGFIYPEEYESFKDYTSKAYKKSKEWIILRREN